jgi:hypothetical protein
MNIHWAAVIANKPGQTQRFSCARNVPTVMAAAIGLDPLAKEMCRCGLASFQSSQVTVHERPGPMHRPGQARNVLKVERFVGTSSS